MTDRDDAAVGLYAHRTNADAFKEIKAGSRGIDWNSLNPVSIPRAVRRAVRVKAREQV